MEENKTRGWIVDNGLHTQVNYYAAALRPYLNVVK
jgi:hypothetical protein